MQKSKLNQLKHIWEEVTDFPPLISHRRVGTRNVSVHDQVDPEVVTCSDLTIPWN